MLPFCVSESHRFPPRPTERLHPTFLESLTDDLFLPCDPSKKVSAPLSVCNKCHRTDQRARPAPYMLPKWRPGHVTCDVVGMLCDPPSFFSTPPVHKCIHPLFHLSLHQKLPWPTAAPLPLPYTSPSPLCPTADPVPPCHQALPHRSLPSPGCRQSPVPRH